MTSWHDANKSSTLEECRRKLFTDLSHWRRSICWERLWSFSIFWEHRLHSPTLPWSSVLMVESPMQVIFCALAKLLHLYGRGDSQDLVGNQHFQALSCWSVINMYCCNTYGHPTCQWRSGYSADIWVPEGIHAAWLLGMCKNTHILMMLSYLALTLYPSQTWRHQLSLLPLTLSHHLPELSTPNS